MAESAHLIWKHRCERVIQNEGRWPTHQEIRDRWAKAMNTRLKLDCNMTDKRYDTKKALSVKTVLRTWKGVLKDEDRLPVDWTRSAEVLVGMDW
jgi:ribonuclease HI